MRRLVAELEALRCDQLGLKAGYDSWEYPLWVLTRRSAVLPAEWEHVMVENTSRPLEAGSQKAESCLGALATI